MKRIVFLLGFAILTLGLQARVVKFSVDMAGQEISPNGVHVTGDFQELAGFPGGDWSPNSTPLAREGQTTIYSTLVSIPAFRYYEYRFVNGDQFYETEFVPVESRVGYDFNDNRWIYVDSLANDTLDIGAILFGGNAPAGKFLLRFNLNAQLLTNVHPAGIRVAGNFNSWNTALTRLVSFDGQHWEGIVFLPVGNYAYRYVNGNTSSGLEIVPAACAADGNREIALSDHSVLEPVCFGACVDCDAVGLRERETHAWFSVKQCQGQLDIRFEIERFYRIAVFDVGGRLLHSSQGNGNQCLVPILNNKGPVLISISSGRYFATTKLIIQ